MSGAVSQLVEERRVILLSALEAPTVRHLNQVQQLAVSGTITPVLNGWLVQPLSHDLIAVFNGVDLREGICSLSRLQLSTPHTDWR